MLAVAWWLRAAAALADHLNHNGSVHLGTWWRVLISVVAPVALGYVLVDAFLTDVDKPYERLPASGCCSPSAGARPRP